MGIALTMFVYAVAFYDTSVGVGEGRRVQNLGLMQQRMVGIVVSIVLAVVAAFALWKWPRREFTKGSRTAGWLVVGVLLAAWVGCVVYAHIVITMLNE